MERDELARIAALLEQIRDNQSEQLARQREALEFQKSQLELVRRQPERPRKSRTGRRSCRRAAPAS